MSDEAEDLRHETPPKGFASGRWGDGDNGTIADAKPQQNPFKTVEQNAEEYLRWALDRDGLHAEPAGAVRVTLRELDRLREAQPDLRPKPEFLAYADPAGKFECNPAGPAFTGENLTVLELRVMAAHLATALDTVNAELKRRM